MISNWIERADTKVCSGEVEACIGFASAIKLIHERRSNASSGTKAKIDFVIDQLTEELHRRLQGLESIMHEKFVQTHTMPLLEISK